MNINSNALAHEIAPGCRSLVSRRNPRCGTCYFASNICFTAKYRLAALNRAGGKRPHPQAGGRMRMGPRWQSGLNSTLLTLQVGATWEKRHSSHLRADTPWSVCPGQGVHAGYLFICARDLFGGAMSEGRAPIWLAASPVWLAAKPTGPGSL